MTHAKKTVAFIETSVRIKSARTQKRSTHEQIHVCMKGCKQHTERRSSIDLPDHSSSTSRMNRWKSTREARCAGCTYSRRSRYIRCTPKNTQHKRPSNTFDGLEKDWTRGLLALSLSLRCSSISCMILAMCQVMAPFAAIIQSMSVDMAAGGEGWI